MRIKLILLATVIMFHHSNAAEVAPVDVSPSQKYLCTTTAEFVLEQIKNANKLGGPFPAKAVTWSSSNIEVVLISHSTTCGNLGCSAFISFFQGEGCKSKPIQGVEPSQPLIFSSSAVNTINRSGCSSWQLQGDKIIRSGC